MTEEKVARLAALRAAKQTLPQAGTATTQPIEAAFNDRPAMTLQTFVLVLFAMGGGALTAAVVVPMWFPALSASLLGPSPKAFWYLSRSSALIAYILVWLSMVFGLLMTNKLARLWPSGPTAFMLHQHTSLLGLGFALFHALILLGDRYIGYTIAQLVIPFASTSYQPLWVGLGQLAFYGLALVGLSFYAKQWIGRTMWRAIHFLSFALFGLALAHGIASGSDSSELWVRALYWLTGSTVCWLTIYRVAVAYLSRPLKHQSAAQTKM
ncbi:MAG: hypothetical protein H7Z42_00720 [Roseiflexaceae bacterium]|nr:hypothetical protein [Roseiflexaceae bacterium]